MISLRARILLAFSFIAVAVTIGAFVTEHVQRNHIIDAVDSRIDRVISSPKFIEKRIETGRLGKPAGAGLFDAYLGFLSGDDPELTTLSTPDDDPDYTPDLTGLNVGDEPRTTPSNAGTTSSARAALVDLGNGTTAVIAIPLTSADRAISRLRTTLGVVVFSILIPLLLLLWWILRLGIKPMRELTAAAAAVSKGDSPDVSTVVAPSREASELKDAVNHLIESTRANESEMRRFVADASHELRTPLTTLRGYAAHASSLQGDPTVVDEALSRISEESLRMSRLVDDLLTLARSDEAAHDVFVDFDVVALVQDLAADLRVVQQRRSIEVIAPEYVSLFADKGAITQALLALTGNVMRHTPEDSTLTVTVTADDSSATIKVSDSGPGIPEADRARIFDRFYRANTTTSGSGLGLAIFASIINRHRGKFGVESREGLGSTFWFTLPRARTID